MRKSLPIIFLLLVFLAPVALWAQQPKLSIISFTRQPADDTIYWNGSDTILTYTAIVQNVGNDQLTGTISIMMEYPLGTQPEEKFEWPVTNFEVGLTDTVSYNDTLNTITGNRYKGGDNVLVIWPHSDNPSIQAPDTSDHDVYIDLSNDVGNPVEFTSRVEAWPNPVTADLRFRYVKDRHKLEYVRVVDLAGRELVRRESAVERLDLSGLDGGLYFVELRYRDGVRGTFRIQIAR